MITISESDLVKAVNKEAMKYREKLDDGTAYKFQGMVLDIILRLYRENNYADGMTEQQYMMFLEYPDRLYESLRQNIR